jgi:hypothetical protein
MFKKGELTTQQIVIIIILIASFVVILFFILKLNLGGETAQDVCHNSVVARGTAIVPSGAFPLKCQRQYVCLSADGNCAPMTKPTIIKVQNKTQVYQALADQLANCWWMFGEGKIDYSPSTTFPENYCSLCSQIAFDPSVYSLFGGSKNFSMKDFYQYLSMTKMSGGQTYEEYFLLNGILSYQGNFGSVDMTKEYYALMGITSKMSKVGWIIGGAVALGAIASIPLTGGLSLIAIGTAAGGAVIGGAAGYVASTYLLAPSVKGPSGNYYIPPSLIQVNSAQFRALNCSDITTSS